jgi:FMN phosphatase YigB (HAD superfamily)
MKSLIIFDLDGTLTESKSPLDAEMATLLGQTAWCRAGDDHFRRRLAAICHAAAFQPWAGCAVDKSFTATHLRHQVLQI